MKMNNKIISIIAFAVGACIGSAATWYVLKDKFEKQYQEDIQAVKESLLPKNKPLTTCVTLLSEKSEDPVEKDEEFDIKKDYKNVINKYDYTQFSQNKEEALSEEVEENMSGPYIIPPEQFDESDYDLVSLTYYADGVIADSISDDIIEDPEDLLGEFRSHFGEYEDDSVYVRNDEERIDYEILSDSRKYSDVVGRKYANVANQDFLDND